MESIYIVNQEKRHAHCPYCSYESDRKNNLKRHIITMHYDSSKVLECCGEFFKSKAALRDHVAICHKSGYRCHVCSRNFCRKALLRRHLTVHSGEKDFRCPDCPYATSHKSNLERHQKIHSKNQRSVSKPLESILEKEENSKNLTYEVTSIFRKIHKKYVTDKSIPEPRPSSPNISSANNNILWKYDLGKNDRGWLNKKSHSKDSKNYLEVTEMRRHENDFQNEYLKTDKVGVLAKDLKRGKSMILTSDDTLSSKTVQSSDTTDSDVSLLSEDDNESTDAIHSQFRLWQRPYKCHGCKKAFSCQFHEEAHGCRKDPIRNLEIPVTCMIKKNMLDFADNIKFSNFDLMRP